VLAIRPALTVLVVAIATIVGAVLAILSRLFDRTGATVLRLARVWAKGITRFAGVRILTDVRVPLDPKRPYVFMSNHASTVDIWALYVALPIPVRMLAKKQLAAIPLLGWAMWAGRFIFIDRHNAVSARRSIERARERIRGGESVLIFPEGTRTRDGALLPFKKGGFHLALEAGVPIVPVALSGTRDAMPRGSWLVRAGEVKVTVGEPFETANLSPDDRDRLLDDVRSRIAGLLAESQ
jgi:1-acyl-sn-glycerol-3-phosphate acyltransferase